IAAAPGDEGELAASALSRTGERIAGDAAKLLHRVDGSIADYGAELAGGVLVYFKSIDRDVGLIGARAGDCALQSDAGLLIEERCRIAAVFDGKIVELLHLEVVAHG